MPEQQVKLVATVFRNGQEIHIPIPAGQASDLTKIDCKATECMYNEHCACHAGKISVEGSNACDCDGTECATFTCDC